MGMRNEQAASYAAQACGYLTSLHRRDRPRRGARSRRPRDRAGHYVAWQVIQSSVSSAAPQSTDIGRHSEEGSLVQILLQKSQIAWRQFSCCKKSDRRPPIDVAPITLPRSPASLSSGDEVPHIFARKSRVQPKEILSRVQKRLLQQNLPTTGSRLLRYRLRFGSFGHPKGEDDQCHPRGSAQGEKGCAVSEMIDDHASC